MSDEKVRRRLDEIVLQAAALTTTERPAFFAELADTEPDLLAEAQRLLAEAAVLPSSFLAVPAGDLLATLSDSTEELPTESDDESPPRTAEDRYQIEEMLGQGGMARVYRAWDKQLERQVALKFLDHPSPGMRRRLVREARAQARVQHRHVLEVYETDERDGTPYIAMRYVPGGTTLADLGNEVSLEQKVRLSAQVAEALHAAHRQGLLHRDVKPSNVLVEETPDRGLEPWVADFGIAAREEGESSAGSQFAGTPHFLAPERLLDGEDVDRRADVYSLGVTMYRLFTGELPYTAGHLIDVLQQIRTEEPRPPREAMPGLPPELEAILLKCLAKDRSARYPSARAVAEDLRRYLDGEVVEAYTASLAHRVGKFMVRHRRLLTVAGIAAILLLVVLVAFAATTSIQAQRIAHKADSLERVSKFLIEMFEIADPYGAEEPGRSRGETVTVREALDRAREQLAADETLTEEPEVRARLLDSLGMVYRGLTLYEPAEPLLREALALRRQALGAENLDVAESLFHLGTLVSEKGDWAESESLLRQSLELRQRFLGDEHLDIAASLKSLAFLDYENGDYAGAEELYRRSLAIYRLLLGPEHLEVAEVLNNLGMVLSTRGDFAEAEPLHREALEIRKRQVGDEHVLVVESLVNLGGILQALDNYAEAELLLRESLTLHRRLLGDRHIAVANNLHALAGVLRERGELAQAEPLYREALEIVRDLLGERHVVVPIVMGSLASVLAVQGQAEEAESLGRQAVATLREILPEGHWRISYAEGVIGASLAALGQPEEAEELLLRAHAVVRDQTGERSSATRYLVQRLIELYETRDQPEKADEYRGLLVSGVV